jgi:hypothetical protein
MGEEGSRHNCPQVLEQALRQAHRKIERRCAPGHAVHIMPSVGMGAVALN